MLQGCTAKKNIRYTYLDVSRLFSVYNRRSCKSRPFLFPTSIFSKKEKSTKKIPIHPAHLTYILSTYFLFPTHYFPSHLNHHPCLRYNYFVYGMLLLSLYRTFIIKTFPPSLPLSASLYIAYLFIHRHILSFQPLGSYF